MKQTQISRVESMLKKEGRVSRNFFIGLPYNRITRLGAIIHTLREQGMDIKTEETNNDTVYSIKPKRVEHYNIILPDGTKIPHAKNVWQ